MGEHMSKRPSSSQTVTPAPQDDVFRLALERMDQGICLIDAQLRFVFFNQRFVELQGLPAGRFGSGDGFEDFVRYQIEQGEYGEDEGGRQIADRLALMKRGEVHTLERRRPNGTVLDIRRAPLPDGGFLTTYTDITHTRRVERELAANEERQALILEAAAEGIYDWDIVRDHLYISPRLDELTNFEWGEHGHRSEAWVSRVHPDDRVRYQASLLAYFKGKTERLDCEYRLADREGYYRWLRDHGKCVRGADGRGNYEQVRPGRPDVADKFRDIFQLLLVVPIVVFGQAVT